MSKADNKIATRIMQWRNTLCKNDTWCILIAADPDALGAAMALKRILSYRVKEVTIASINTVTRPDNLAMLRYLRIPLVDWQENMVNDFSHFAIVDSQPHHNPAFEKVKFSVIIDHHPLAEKTTYEADFIDICPEYGATCTMMTRYIKALNIRPGKLLATAMLYGIRADTAAFDRSGITVDFQAYQYLSRFADINLMRRIFRSEYLLSWLPLFSRAFRSLKTCKTGAHAHVGDVKSPDLLVAIADFFTRVHGLRWVAVSGVFNDTAVIIFRSDGSKNMGNFASQLFGDIGSAGGHKNMARAEIPIIAIDAVNVQDFIYGKLMPYCKTKKRKNNN